MSLTRIDISLADAPPRGQILDFLARAESQLLSWERQARRVPEFVCSNFRLAHAMLAAVRPLAAGRRFCEWGSGSGIVTCLASLLGYDAVGIEINPELCAFAEQLADECRVAARFHLGSYKPPGSYTETVDEQRLEEELGFDPFDFDVIYVYPWPAEERVVLQLFERFSGPEALLVTYHGGADIRLHAQPAQSRGPLGESPGWTA